MPLNPKQFSTHFSDVSANPSKGGSYEVNVYDDGENGSDEPVGSLKWAVEHGETAGNMRSLEVHPEYRNQGIATHMVGEANRQYKAGKAHYYASDADPETMSDASYAWTRRPESQKAIKGE